MSAILERMRRARELQGLDLEALSQRTRLRTHQLEAIEQGRFDLLPRGVYARAVIRAYASAVGLEPNNAVAELAPLLPDLEDPLEGIARVHGYSMPARRQPHQDGTPAQPSASRKPGALWRAWLAGGAPEAVADVPTPLVRASAAAIDGLVLAGITGALVTLSAKVAGVPVLELMEFAAPALAFLAILIAALYFLLLGGIAGATMGARACRLDVRRPAVVNLPSACRRAGAVAARELSIVVDLMVPFLLAHGPTGKREGGRSDTRWEERPAGP